jgi:flagellin
MAMTINTNIAALNAQNNLGRTQGTLNQALQRLSSGLRINSAKDDAAGLAISDRMTVQIRGLNQAARNANDGISLAQTAEGALQESANILQRIRELAVQSANDTNSSSDRANLQKEVAQLQDELNRIADQTTFNSKNLLDGSFASQKFHVGYQADETISISIGSARGTSMGAQQINGTDTRDHVGTASQALQAIATATGTTNNVAGDDLTIAGPLGISTATIDAGMSAAEISSAINGQEGSTGVSATASNSIVIDNVATGTISFTLTSEQSTNIIGSAGTITAVVTDSNDLTALRDAINAETSKTGISATLSTSGAEITLTNSDGSDIVVEGVSNNDGADTAAVMDVGGVTLEDEDLTASGTETDSIIAGGKVKFSASSAFSVSGDATTDVLTVASTSSTLSQVAEIDVGTQSGSNDALNVVDEALSFITRTRADLGAVQNRFESTIANLQSVSENVSAARARIMDADFAAETANLTKAQVMQQAGVAMLAQANMLPQTVLTLLQ